MHLKGLTEIRGIAALLVLFSHIDQFHEVLKIPSIRISETGIADHAVTIFFTLSGFLITYLLLAEKKKTGNIAIRNFYFRRILKIWPAYYLTIFFSLMLMVVGFFNAPESNRLAVSLGGFMIMVPNVLYVFGMTIAGTSPLWSIGVEEQFYLVWPIVAKKLNNLKPFLWSVVLLYLVAKITIYWVHPTGGAYALVKLTRFDCMAIGAMVALAIGQNRERFLSLLFHPASQVLSSLVLVSPFIYPFHVFADLNIEVYASASIIWIANTAFNPKSFIRINSGALRFFGKISYGMYVYHLLFIYLFGRLPFEFGLLFTYLLVPLVVSGFSYLSYELIEKRFLTLKEKYATIQSKR